MKKLVVFDLDGTLAQSKSSFDAEMAALFDKLLLVIKVAVISGGNWPQFQKQVLSHLASDERLKNLSLLPTCGTQFYQYEIGWEKLYAEDFTNEQKTYEGIEFDGVDNKDASVFPVAIPDPDGKPAMAILHRPLFPGTHPEETVSGPAPRVVDLHRESIWISYCPLGEAGDEPYHLCHFTLHSRLASPVAPWEQLKIGGGTPPILTRHGWMVIYHGVHELAEPGTAAHKLCYSAGVLVLPRKHPRHVRYRSPKPVLTPELPQERIGTVANVVFPAANDRRDDLGLPDRFDVYYGMADNRIGVARLDVPEFLPSEGPANPARAKDLRPFDGQSQTESRQGVLTSI